MKTELIMVGKTVDKLYTKGISDYQERIGHYMPFNITVIPAPPPLRRTRTPTSCRKTSSNRPRASSSCDSSSRRTRWFCSTSTEPNAQAWRWLHG